MLTRPPAPKPLIDRWADAGLTWGEGFYARFAAAIGVSAFSLYILLLFRGLRAAGMSQDVFGRLVATGVVIFILFQTFINIAVNLRLFPVTGIPLPFISAGGSSLVTVFIAIGLLQSVVMRRNQVTL